MLSQGLTTQTTKEQNKAYKKKERKNMKLQKTVFAAVATALLASASIQAKDEMKRVYIFGMASSFNDSTVCFTDIQAVDSAWITGKAHFLVSRENYSYQLYHYLEDNMGFKNPTCMVSYSTSLSAVKKKWQKLHDRYTAKPKAKKKKNGLKADEAPRYQVKTVGMESFVFKAVAPDQMEVASAKSKKDARKALKEMKGKQRPGGMPPGGGMPPSGEMPSMGNMPPRQ